jgi:hypothetical protein
MLVLKLLALTLELRVSRSVKFSEDMFLDNPIGDIGRLVISTIYLVLFTCLTILN